MNGSGQKVIEVMEKFQLIYKRVILGIIIFILLLLILFDSLIMKQTIIAKDYIETTATFVEEKTDGESEVFNDYIYTFEDKEGNQQKIIISLSKDSVIEEKVKIKYNEKNPQDFYEEGATFDKSGIIWYGVKIVVMILLIVLFFHKKLLSKVNITASSGS